MTQAHIDLQSQLDSQNILYFSDPSTLSLCNTSPIFFLSPIEPTKNSEEQIDTNNTVTKSSDTDKDVPYQTKNLLNHLHLHLHDIMKDPIFLTSPVFPPQIFPKDSISTQEMIISYRFYRTKISPLNLD